MRNIILVSVSILFSSVLCSQTYVGVRGGIASTWIFNKNIADAGDELDYNGSSGGNIGLHVMQLISDQSGVGLYFGTRNLNQELASKIGETESLSEIKMKYTDIGLFYTYLAEGGLFLEVGPQFSLRKDEVTEIFDKGEEDELERTIIDPFLNSSTVFGVLGVGGMIDVNDQLKLSLGIRLGYGFTDLTEDLPLDQAVAITGDSETTSLLTSFALDVDYDEEAMVDTKNYQGTHPAFGSFNIGLYYTIGGKTSE